MGSEDFAYMLKACPCAFINIEIGSTDGPLHNPRCDLRPCRLGRVLFARLVEKKLARPLIGHFKLNLAQDGGGGNRVVSGTSRSRRTCRTILATSRA
jgi:hypothetical protein